MSPNSALVRRFLPAPDRSFFLFGPRGTGKSTWTQENAKDALRIDLLAPEVFRSFAARPERLREVVEGDPRRKTIIVDELQKVPALLPLIHSLIEEKKGTTFILTGSSSRKLKRTGADLLAGRAVVRAMHPFMAAELAAKFDFGRALKFGLLPLAWQAKDPEDVLRAYAALYVREEVQAEGLVRNVGNFSRFLEEISFSQAGVLNLSNVARDCEVERKVVEGYLGVLEDLLLAFRLPVFSKRAKRAVSVHPKFYLFDAGVFRSLRPSGPLDRPQEIDGLALESLVAQHLRAWNDYGGGRHRLAFWRTRSGVEVDFVLHGPDGFWAVEVKNAARVRDEDLRGLRAFGEDYPEATRFLLYRGKECLKRHGILCLPCEEFLRKLVPGNSIGF
ncbi:MAG: ATP-binding protein [Elusimicrobia bacterium]|nr:ATP-binding protein [Elusimicrobiota bacterium]